MTTRAEEAELLARVVKGDHDAFTELMRAHEDRVFSVCLRIMGDRERALDATQETFLTVFRKAGQFQGKSALGTWIYRIAVNHCYDDLRKARRERSDPLPEHADPADLSAAEAIDAAGLRPELRLALMSLPPDSRAAVVLSDIEGFTVAEAAEALGVPTGTVKSRVFRGRRMLAKGLGEPCGHNERRGHDPRTLEERTDTETDPQLNEHEPERTHLRQAIELAIGNASSGQLPFGAVVVIDDRVVATGVNTALRDDDPTAHAEVAAVRAACRTLRTLDLSGAIIYSSCEPCAMCHAVATAAGMAELVYAATGDMVPDLGSASPNRELMESMQRELRSLASQQLRHLPIEGAEEPFQRFQVGT